MNKKLRAIQIIYHPDQYIWYLLISEFFRFIGIYVAATMPDETKEHCEVDITITLGLDPDQIRELIKPEKNISILNEDISGHVYEWKNQRKLLYDIVKKMQAAASDYEWDMIVWKNCIQIFSGYNLMRYNLIRQYYYKTKELLEDAKKYFYYAYCDLYRLSNKIENPPIYYDYAKLNCAKKVNDLCSMLQAGLKFDTGELLDQAQLILDRDPEFSNVYALMGLISNIDIRYQKKTPLYYQKSMDALKENCYGTYVYYWMGRYLEKTEEGKKNRSYMSYYENAVSRKPSNYRAIYKIAMSYAAESNPDKDYNLALEKFSQIIILILKGRTNKNNCNPTQIEYIMKSHYQSGRVCEELDRAEEAKKHYEEIVRLIQEIEHNQFFNDLYGEQADNYRKYLRKQLCMKNTYKQLSNIYGQEGNEEKQKEYWELAKKLF